MNVQLVLFGLALLFRAQGALWRREAAPLWQLPPGWLLSSLAVWSALVGVGAWAPFWPILPVVLVGVALHYRWREKTAVYPLIFLADALLILAAGLLALPPLGWGTLLPTAVLLPLLGLLVDWVARWLVQRVNWLALAVVGVLPLLLLLVVPTARSTVGRMLQSRFVYLLPEAEEVTLVRPTATADVDAAAAPTGTATATAVSSMATAESPTATAPAPVEVTEMPGGLLDATGTQWAPYIEWSLTNPSYEGNPFDVEATATFVHTETGETHTTGLFYAGENTWQFRFTGTQPGEWLFTTSSEDPELNGREGTVTIAPNPDGIGFVTNFGDKWGRMGTDRAFVPQYVMIGNPLTYYNNPAEIQYNIDTFFTGHGFNGVHTPVFCRWFDIEQQQCSRINVADPNPDMRTFEALEDLITEVHAAGGVVHIWMWGDDSRSENQKRWGINGLTDRRLQRYIAARLGPLPGWTMGYGYDLFEWVDGDDLTEWHDFMHSQMGWNHYLGARSRTNRLDQLSEAMDYSSYEQHRPDYDLYVESIGLRPEKPTFSEDRFRIRDEGRDKDYTMTLTRRGLWHSTMAGGVANIWGNLLGAPQANDSLTTSAPYPNPEMIKTYATFFANRFWEDMIRCNGLTNGVCLMRQSRPAYIFYAEDTAVVEMDLSQMESGQTAVAVDTLLPYAEIELGLLSPENHTWEAPYPSDWAIAVGTFDD
ncbi:MAG: DUF5060 domain-containing protein [Anaerolineaceae bacterium]|nr:DUF5060 domain-containing protein [Anaerolineaceae bacterium]